MHHRRIRLVILSTFAFLLLAAAQAAPAAAQYGPQSPPPPPPPGQGGYYQPAPGPGYYQPPPPPPGVQRRGFTIGGSLGGGSFGYSDEESRFEGGTIEFHIGGMITPQLGILFDWWGVGAAINDHETFVHTIGSVALRWFVGQRFWLQGGLGYAGLSVSDDQGNSAEVDESGGALVLGVGFELFQSSHVTIDVSLRFGAAGYTDYGVNMSSLQFGLNWY